MSYQGEVDATAGSVPAGSFTVVMSGAARVNRLADILPSEASSAVTARPDEDAVYSLDPVEWRHPRLPDSNKYDPKTLGLYTPNAYKSRDECLSKSIGHFTNAIQTGSTGYSLGDFYMPFVNLYDICGSGSLAHKALDSRRVPVYQTQKEVFGQSMDVPSVTWMRSIEGLQQMHVLKSVHKMVRETGYSKLGKAFARGKYRTELDRSLISGTVSVTCGQHHIQLKLTSYDCEDHTKNVNESTLVLRDDGSATMVFDDDGPEGKTVLFGPEGLRTFNQPKWKAL
ncbi:uncharacterized protein I303_101398 [Kwoniella dejecticola CBS 10117]|uniref:Uncharacterized protein n=1 Tax=Kwoniella dejecticola CBS 10117 TaxID=1296121 RepID=A0A1A6AHT7_9TREE|nr:uncharacterized protein I303_01407 [Kwoniella dejecticola CBS 10117]OBR89578.1 hypothetical protein I303_01407 [Kwoniella dejecticola CBS 10117]